MPISKKAKEEQLREYMNLQFTNHKKIVFNRLQTSIYSGVDSLFSSSFLQYGVMEIKDFDSYIEGICLLDFLLACNFCLSSLEQLHVFEDYKKESDFDEEQFSSLLTLISHTKYHWIDDLEIMKLATFCEKLLYHSFVVDGYIREFTTH